MKPTLRILAMVILAFIFICLVPLNAYATMCRIREKQDLETEKIVKEEDTPELLPPEEPQEDQETQQMGPPVAEEIPIEEQIYSYLDALPVEVTKEQRERIDTQLSLYISDEESRAEQLLQGITGREEVGPRSYFKSWADYRALGRSTNNYKLCAAAQVDDNGLLVYDGYYLVAMGSGWGTELGATFIIITDELNVIPVMICDEKSDRHTNSTHKYHRTDGSVVEFYVDSRQLCWAGRHHGSIGKVPGFEGNIIAIIPLSGRE